jgi:5-(carboxyamino)imidazole ribonucleotide synthase
MSAHPVLKPGDKVGILGGGQLGRMLALAAAELGLKCHIYAPDAHSCAFDVVDEKTCAPYEDEAALARFADAVSVVTYEFENIPATTAKFLKSRRPVLPNPDALEIVQDRLTEKDFVTQLGIGTAGYAGVNSLEELQAAIAKLGAPAVLKTRRMGYDGKGQASVKTLADAASAWDVIGRSPAILEQFVLRTCTAITFFTARACRRRSPARWPDKRASWQAKSQARLIMSGCWRSKCSSSMTAASGGCS